MADFCRTLGEVIQRPSWLPVPKFVLELLLGEAAQVLVEGQKVIPQKAMQGGYTFLYPTAKQALKNLLG
jgi:NAD dependent epimerase/dehydratase family enzyme